MEIIKHFDYHSEGDTKPNAIKEDTSTSNMKDGISNTVYNITNTIDNDDGTFRVIQGTNAVTTSVPYQVGFFRSGDAFWEKYTAFCGGALIAPTKIITAAHCFVKPSYFECCKGKLSRSDLWTIRAAMGMLVSKGNPRSSSYPEQWRRVVRGKYPQNFKFPEEDICVMFTENPFNLNEHVSIIPYDYHYAASDLTGKACVISGYGRVNDVKKSKRLQYGHVTILSNEMCSGIHRKSMRKFLCTSDVFSDPAKGDSGGPLNCENHLVGVVSGKQLFTRSGTFFTRLSAYDDFISGSVVVKFSYYFLLTSLLLIHVLSL